MRRFKRVIARSLFFALSLIAIISMAVSAAPLNASTTKALSTNFTLVNLGAGPASVSVQYYKPDGSTWTVSPENASFTIDGNFGQRVIAQYFDSLMSPGKGSVVVNSSAPLGAVVQLLARGQISTSGAYSGITEPSSRYFVPQVLRQRVTGNGVSNTQIAIQNSEASGATSVTVQFIPYPGSGYQPFTKSGISIQPGAAFLYDIADESPSNLPDGWYGSAVVTANSGRKISVVVNIFAGPNSLTTFNAFPEEDVTSSWLVPLFTSRLPNGLSTPVVVQNLSGGSLAVNAITMSCKSSVSTPATFTARNTAAVPNNASYAFNPVVDNALPSNWTGACRVSVSGGAGVVVYVQMRKPQVTEEFSAYEAFPANSTDPIVVVPLVSKRQPNGFATAVTIQNVDPTNEARVRLRYVPAQAYIDGGGSASQLTFNVTIPPDGNRVENHRLPSNSGGVAGMPDGWYGTLVVEPQPGQPARPIVAFVQLTNYQGAPGDTAMAHNAFTLPTMP